MLQCYEQREQVAQKWMMKKKQQSHFKISLSAKNKIYLDCCFDHEDQIRRKNTNKIVPIFPLSCGRFKTINCVDEKVHCAQKM